MKRRREEERELRNSKRRKQVQRRLEEQEWKRERHTWSTGSHVSRKDLEQEEKTP